MKAGKLSELRASNNMKWLDKPGMREYEFFRDILLSVIGGLIAGLVLRITDSKPTNLDLVFILILFGAYAALWHVEERIKKLEEYEEYERKNVTHKMFASRESNWKKILGRIKRKIVNSN